MPDLAVIEQSETGHEGKTDIMSRIIDVGKFNRHPEAVGSPALRGGSRFIALADAGQQADAQQRQHQGPSAEAPAIGRALRYHGLVRLTKPKPSSSPRVRQEMLG